MLNMNEIEWAISELEREESSFSNYAKLANLYIIREQNTNHDKQDVSPVSPQRESEILPLALQDDIINVSGQSEFLQAVSGKPVSVILPVIDGLMENLRIISPKVYDSVLRKLQQL